MNYSVYSYVALSPLRSGGQPNPPAQQPEGVSESAALKFAGTARVAAAGPWYSRLWKRIAPTSAQPAGVSRVDFEVVLNLPPELRSQLELGSEGAVIEIQLTRVTAADKEES